MTQVSLPSAFGGRFASMRPGQEAPDDQVIVELLGTTHSALQ